MRLLTVLVLGAIPLLAGGCGIPIAVSAASYAADGMLLLTTDKTGSDHLMSLSTGQDCAMWRVAEGRTMCVDYKPGEENPYRVDRDAPFREVGEGGMVTVYTASHQGGRMLTGEDAGDALKGTPPVATLADVPAAAASTPPAAVASQPAAASTAASAGPRPKARKAAGRTVKPGGSASAARRRP
ncbi:hypothetical protein FHP25_01070 [Vineibacter terrae]|uniref:Uncharacterized protein n=1 Tax=Vineibacter terrae TaxID=2586908 RepID=A0A5C8PVI1_9HYPH|nr:hypothetical protein [Vineibacter terrae]TXL82318.1 hypothetical protein FHP25_01070 [Vineibacter terrae]